MDECCNAIALGTVAKSSHRFAARESGHRARFASRHSRSFVRKNRYINAYGSKRGALRLPHPAQDAGWRVQRAGRMLLHVSVSTFVSL
jgi:hypothetical protein